MSFKLKTMRIFNLVTMVLLLLCLCPSTAMPGDGPAVNAGAGKGPERLFHKNRLGVFSDLELIACIDDPEMNTYKTVPFTLETDRILRLYALGRGSAHRMLDYGGIEDTATGQMVWIMRFLSTEYGGGIKTLRKTDRVLPLKAGSYRLHFKTNSFQPPGNRAPISPGAFNTGIWLFDDTNRHTALLDRFWDKAVYPGDFGWSGAKLKSVIPEMEKFGTDALMVVTDGKLIFGYGSTTNIIRAHSIRKSLLSGLYGIYTANGRIDLNTTLGQLGIVESTPLTAREKQATVLDLLKARSGIYLPAAAESSSMRNARPQRGRHKPGTFWYYNNWDFNVLGTIFHRETGRDIYQAFKEDIADPIGMQDFTLKRQAYHYERKYSLHPAYPFLISARDLAKFGQLFLRQGRWNRRQIIPSDWIAACKTSYSQTTRPGIGYGYMWWILTQDMHGLKRGGYFADGYGGQRLYILPHINSVIVHRINIQVPGTNAVFSELAPDAVIKRIMKAYTGKKDIRKAFKPKEAGGAVVEKPLLDYYGRSPGYYGKSFKRFRIIFWICGVILASGLVFKLPGVLWRGINKPGEIGLGHPQKRDPRTGKGSRFAGMLKWTAAVGGFICAVYIFVILTIPFALEYVAMVGMPSGLNLHQTLLIHVPKFAVLFTFFLLTGSILSWTRRYWTIFERIHFGLITTAAISFTSLAYRLDLILLM